VATSKPKRAALYLRTSTREQTTQNQRRELKAAAKRHGWKVVAVFEDAGISGAKGRDARRGLDGLLIAARRREFDLVAAWSVDRLGRSLQDLVALLSELQAKRVGLYLHQQGLDSSTPAGKAMFQMLGMFAEFERSLIKERVLAGLARAREQGRVGGRPRTDVKKEQEIRDALVRGVGIRKVARSFGVGTSVVQRIRQEAKLG
jgi:DNA invertase Pin-like site-specific DNA recombinase